MLLVWISEQTDRLLRERLGPFRKGALSSFVEEAILEHLAKLEQSAERMHDDDKHVIEGLIRRLQEENRHEVTKREVEKLITSMGVVSARRRSSIIKQLLISRIFVPKVVRGNTHIYYFTLRGEGVGAQANYTR